MFDEIVYDLDRRRIVDFKVKQWAEPYVIMRSTLYRDQMGEEMKNRFNSGLSSKVSYCSPNRASALTTIHEQEIELAKCLLFFITYDELDVVQPLSTRERNDIIRARYGEGTTISKLAEEFGISPQRVHQIVNFKNK